MPPRHAYWTILVDDQPTAFRAHDADELQPTLNRLKDRHASAVMKWFERGKLWNSKDEARAHGLGRGERRWEGPRPDRSDESPVRDRNWRPGGDHRDPRQKYKDAKKAKWAKFKQKRRDRGRRDDRPATSDVDPRKFSPPHGDPLRSKTRHEHEDRRRDDRQRDARWRDDRRRDHRPRDSQRTFDGDEFRPKWSKPRGPKKRFDGRKPWESKSKGPPGHGDRPKPPFRERRPAKSRQDPRQPPAPKSSQFRSGEGGPKPSQFRSGKGGTKPTQFRGGKGGPKPTRSRRRGGGRKPRDDE